MPAHDAKAVRGDYVTLAQISAERMRLVAICKGCGREAPIDLEMLVRRFGPDFQPGRHRTRFGAALRCVECAGRVARVEFRAGRTDTWGGAHGRSATPDG